MNVVVLGGIVVDEVVRGTTKTGTSQVRFSLKAADGIGEYARDGYHRVQAFGRAADQVPYLDEGSLCTIVGRLGGFKGDDGKWITTITAEQIELVRSAESANAPPKVKRPAQRPPEPANPVKGVAYDDGFSDGLNDSLIPF